MVPGNKNEKAEANVAQSENRCRFVCLGVWVSDFRCLGIGLGSWFHSGLLKPRTKSDTSWAC